MTKHVVMTISHMPKHTHRKGGGQGGRVGWRRATTSEEERERERVEEGGERKEK